MQLVRATVYPFAYYKHEEAEKKYLKQAEVRTAW